MDYLTIDNLAVYGAHGYYDHERTIEQEFEVSLRVGADLGSAGKSDTLADTIDYDDLKRIIEETFADESRYLMESLAEVIAKRILSQTPACEVTISIRKKAVWSNGIPGVSLTRVR